MTADGAGHVLRFAVEGRFLAACAVQEAGGRAHRESWSPAADLDASDAATVGPIEVVRSFGRPA